MENSIQKGQYVVVQRQNFTKLHKFTDSTATVQMGRDTVELKAISDQPWFKTFKMTMTEGGGKRRIYSLEPCDNATDFKEILKTIESGTDNRNIHDDGQSQTLSNEEILSMRDNISDSKEIIGTLVANSKSFNEKTEFSQEKYIKKKEKKYFDFIQIRKPTIRLIAEIFYRQDPEKPLGLRIDSLSQLISYSGVNSTGNYLIYDSGTSGLLPAAFLNSMGSSGDSKLIHLHPGNFPQTQAILALNLSKEHEKKCVSVNLYSVLRQLYQESSSSDNKEEVILDGIDCRKRKANDDENGSLNKVPKIDNGSLPSLELSSEATLSIAVTPDQPHAPAKPLKRAKWQYENDEAIEVLKQKADSLVIVSKEDPSNIAKELIRFVHPGRPIVIFHTCKEILMECFSALKSLDSVVNLRLLTNWMRNYQVLPMRTHPEVQITGSSGYLLVGYTINSASST